MACQWQRTASDRPHFVFGTTLSGASRPPSSVLLPPHPRLSLSLPVVWRCSVGADCIGSSSYVARQALPSAAGAQRRSSAMGVRAFWACSLALRNIAFLTAGRLSLNPCPRTQEKHPYSSETCMPTGCILSASLLHHHGHRKAAGHVVQRMPPALHSTPDPRRLLPMSPLACARSDLLRTAPKTRTTAVQSCKKKKTVGTRAGGLPPALRLARRPAPKARLRRLARSGLHADRPTAPWPTAVS